MKSEAKIQNEVRLYVGQLPDFVIYRNNTGRSCIKAGWSTSDCAKVPPT